MTAIICIDDRGGILFLKRRVSRDKEVYADVAKEHGRILLSKYSLPLFEGLEIETRVSEAPFAEGKAGDVLFIEDGETVKNLDKLSRLIIYKWNRSYPSDVKLGFEPRGEGFRLTSSLDFAGSSHEKITREVYER